MIYSPSWPNRLIVNIVTIIACTLKQPDLLTYTTGCFFPNKHGCPDSSMSGVCENIRDCCGYISHPLIRGRPELKLANKRAYSSSSYYYYSKAIVPRCTPSSSKAQQHRWRTAQHAGHHSTPHAGRKMMMTIKSPFGQLGLWAPSSGVRDVFTSIAYVFTYPRH
jgi:hypothetical protein